MNTFKHGIHPNDKKELSCDKAIENAKVPNTVYIPISQHLGAPAECVVAVGDTVKKGQLVAKASGFVSSNIFSSVCGTVSAIVKRPNAMAGKIPHIQIENDFSNDQILFDKIENPTQENIIARSKDAGLVGMGGATFPLHVKLSPPKDKVIDTLIINGAECEPYITCDYRILLEKTEEFLKGVEYLQIALQAKNVFVAVEENKADAIEILAKTSKFPIITLKTKYPQGAEKQLIYAVTKRKVPAGGLPMDVGCVVDNVHTAYSLYRAVALGIPLYERVVTVSGEAINEPKNIWTPTGVPYSELVEQCGGSHDAVKIISGGPMMGFSQFNLDAVVAKGTSSILMLTEKEINHTQSRACINCTGCRHVCPMNLMPMYIDGYALAGDFATAKKYGAMHCIECGCCAYVCPSKRPLVQSIRMAKKIIKERKI